MLSQSGRAIFVAYPIMAVVATVGVALRCLSKARTQKKFAADDLLILAGLVLFYAYTVVFMYGRCRAALFPTETASQADWRCDRTLRFRWDACHSRDGQSRPAHRGPEVDLGV